MPALVKPLALLKPPALVKALPLIKALIAGLLVAASVPPWGWWPLGWIGLAIWVELLDGCSAFRRAQLSAVAATAWIAPSTVWMTDFTLPGWLLAVIGYSGMHSVAAIAVPNNKRRYVVFPAVFALAELLRWNWPFGGVPVATVSMGQVSGPLGETARIAGALFVTWLTAHTGATLALIISHARNRVRTHNPKPTHSRLPAHSSRATHGWRAALMPGISVTVILLTITAAQIAPRGRATTDHGKRATDADNMAVNNTVRVAVVQGGGPQNTRADVCAQRGVFERHISTTLTEITQPVDMIVWPEDVVHLSARHATTPNRCGEQTLLKHAEAHTRIAAVARQKNAVLVAGFFAPPYSLSYNLQQSSDTWNTPDPTSPLDMNATDHNLNFVSVYDSYGDVIGEYHKVQLVPFGELVPLRPLFERFNGALPARDVGAGFPDKPAAVDTPLGVIGISISWEVFFSHRARDAIGASSGEVLLNPTNGSSYKFAILQSQQIATSRLRAIETGRWVLQAAPTGFSAVISPEGRVVERSNISESKVIFADIEMRAGNTIATRVGVLPVAALMVTILFIGHATSYLQHHASAGRIGTKLPPVGLRIKTLTDQHARIVERRKDSDKDSGARWKEQRLTCTS